MYVCMYVCFNELKALLFITACNDHYSSNSGTIYSPNYHYKYPHKMSCQNSIENPYGNRITLKMRHFDLESSKDCVKDSLKIYENSISNETLMSTRCGNDTTQYVTKSNRLFLLFKSDSTISGLGYQIDFTSISVSFPLLICELDLVKCFSISIFIRKHQRRGGRGVGGPRTPQREFLKGLQNNCGPENE